VNAPGPDQPDTPTLAGYSAVELTVEEIAVQFRQPPLAPKVSAVVRGSHPRYRYQRNEKLEALFLDLASAEAEVTRKTQELEEKHEGFAKRPRP